MIWARQNPFKGKSENELSIQIHNGLRPKFNTMSDFPPPSIIHMMKMCWHEDPNKRCTAIECLAMLQKVGLQSRDHCDIYFSFCPEKPPTTLSTKRNEKNSNNDRKTKKHKYTYHLSDDEYDAIYDERFFSFAITILHHLIRLGYTVYFDDDADVYTMSKMQKKRIENMVNKCTIFLVLGNSKYIRNESCMYALEYASKCQLQSKQQKNDNIVSTELNLPSPSSSSREANKGFDSSTSLRRSRPLSTTFTNLLTSPRSVSRPLSSRLPYLTITSPRSLSRPLSTTSTTLSNSFASPRSVVTPDSTHNVTSDKGSSLSSRKSIGSSLLSSMKKTFFRNKSETDNNSDSMLTVPNMKPIISIMIEKDIKKWANPDFLKYIGNESLDFSNVDRYRFSNETVQSGEELTELENLVQPLLALLSAKGCHPTFS